MCTTTDAPDQQQLLQAADRVARAAYLWIRHGNAVRYPSTGAASDGQGTRQDVVAGVIFGLCSALDLDERHALLSAYAYALIDGDAADALVMAQSMLRRRDDERYQSAYRHGLTAADDLVALIAAPEAPPLPN